MDPLVALAIVLGPILKGLTPLLRTRGANKIRLPLLFLVFLFHFVIYLHESKVNEKRTLVKVHLWENSVEHILQIN